MATASLALKTYESNCGEDGPWEYLLDVKELPPEAISNNRGDLASPPDQCHLQARWHMTVGGRPEGEV